MALRAMATKSSLAFVVISPPMMAMLDFTYVSQATRLNLSCARQASRTASEIVSATLSGCPSPTDSEEKMYRLLNSHSKKKAREMPRAVRDLDRARGFASPAHYLFAPPPAVHAAHQVGEIAA